MHRSTFASLLVVGGLAATLFGCAERPRYREQFQTRSTAVTFSGVTPVPDQPITVLAGAGPTPIVVAETRARSDDPVVDKSGRKWYSYSTSVVLPASVWQRTGADPARFPQQVYFTYVQTRSPDGPLGNFGSKEYSNHVALEDCAAPNGVPMSGAEIYVKCRIPADWNIIYAGQ
jgi:hypothetical protein